MKKTKEYIAWDHMKQRCLNPNNDKFNHYGGRGISVCERWVNSFSNFLLDVGLSPSKSHTLDRFPNTNGNYEPGNIRWATKQEQMRNTRRSNLFTYKGETKTLTEWASLFGLSRAGLKYRIDTLEYPNENNEWVNHVKPSLLIHSK